MNNEDNHPKDIQSGNPVSSIVPAGWKLWALVFRAIAEGHLTELHDGILTCDDSDAPDEDATFFEAVRGLYIETCNDVSRELPMELYDMDCPKTALHELRDVAQVILDWYEKASHCFKGNDTETKLFERVADNCKIAIQLLDFNSDSTEDEIYPFDPFGSDCFFSESEMLTWYGVVNGTCIREMAFSDFCHTLQCTNSLYEWIEDEDYYKEIDSSGLIITPLTGYGMAMYAFILLLMANRYLNQHLESQYDEDKEELTTGFTEDDKTRWAGLFKTRIDWEKNNYNIREESWKDGYLISGTYPSSIVSDATPEEMDQLGALCARPTFQDVVCGKALDTIIAGKILIEPSFDQYRFIHDEEDNLNDLYQLLVRELDYLYVNMDDIAGRFLDEVDAEADRDNGSRWRFNSRKENSAAIEELYSRWQAAGDDLRTLRHLFFYRCGLAFEYLWDQPLIHSGIIRRYLQDCVIQDERLLMAVRRVLEDGSLQDAIKKVREVSEKQKRIDEAKEAVRMYIDEDGNIKKQSDRISLVRTLIRKRDDGEEYGRPAEGWKSFIKRMKKNNEIEHYWYEEQGATRVLLIDKDNRFTSAFYGVLMEKDNRYARLFLNGIEWSLFDGVFKLNGKALMGEDLKTYIGSRRDLFVDIITDIIKKYEKTSWRKMRR